MGFHRPVPANGRVEDWMTRVLNEMQQTDHEGGELLLLRQQHSKVGAFIRSAQV